MVVVGPRASLTQWGAKVTSAPKLKQVSKSEPVVTGLVFESDLGWMALLVRDGKIARLQFGHASEVAAKRALVAAESAESLTVAWSQPDRLAQGWIRELKNYASGKQASLADLPIEEAGMTPFQRSVRVACRKVKRGEVMTYGELARKVGRPGAARAVGSVMSGNPTPLIVPCHRVLGANGLGGYSAPQGISMKLHLLDLEGAIEHVDCDCEHC